MVRTKKQQIGDIGEEIAKERIRVWTGRRTEMAPSKNQEGWDIKSYDDFGFIPGS